MHQSLSSWSKENKLPKGTVHAKAKALGIDTSNGLDYAAIKLLSKAFDIEPDQPDVMPEIVEANVETQVLTGNHRSSAQLAKTPDSVDLSNLRGGVHMTVFGDDALEAVDQALKLADSLIEAIEDDTEYQLAQLQKTQRSGMKLKKKAQQLRLKQQQYSIESKVLGLAQGKEMSELITAHEEITNLSETED